MKLNSSGVRNVVTLFTYHSNVLCNFKEYIIQSNWSIILIDMGSKH